VEFFEPIGIAQTKIHINYLFTKHKLGNKRATLLQESIKNSANLVYEEDFSLLEKIQSKMNNNFTLMPNNGIYERMIQRFHAIYRRIL